MKKILGLVLALVMILTAVSAFATAPGSKTTEDLSGATTTTETTTTTTTTTTTKNTTNTTNTTTATADNTDDDEVEAKTTNANVTVVVTKNEGPAVTALLKALDETKAAIPAAAAAELEAGSTYTKVEEVTTLKITGGTAEEDLTLNLKFPTSFAGKKVAVFLGVLDNGVIAEWKVIETEGKADGSIDLTLTGAIQDWLNGREFVVMVAD